MKDFFKYLLATVTGIVISSILLFFLFIGIIGAMISKSDKPIMVKENSLLVIKLDKEIVDRSSKNPMEDFDFVNLKPTPKLGLNDILNAIKNAANDPKIKGIYIENDNIPAGAATLEEIRDALLQFKESGKFIVSYSNVYSQKSYYLSSLADEVYMHPEGMVDWVGLRSELMFFKNAFKKLGIEPQIIRHGKFKSAVEPFMDDRMSRENREQIETYMGSIWDHWVKGIAQERGLTVEELNGFADNLTIRNAKSAVENGFIDDLLYKDQIIDRLKELTETEAKKDINSIGIAQYAKVPSTEKGKGFTRDKIAVIYASGGIVMGEAAGDNIAGDRYGRIIREARRDSSVKAIVFRINSGGGSALASDIIWREMELAREVKPVIVSMGDVAASGGYYIAAPAHKILANPTTITGSIGVFGMFFNVKEGMNNKFGVNVDVVKTNKFSDFGTPFRAMTAEERALGQFYVEEVYTTFINHVANGRGITPEQVDEIGQGRVWSGVNALDINLIDEFGGLTRAIELAAEMAEIEHYRISELPELKDPFQVFVEQLTGGAKLKVLEREMGSVYRHYRTVQEMIENQGIMARIPYDIEIY